MSPIFHAWISLLCGAALSAQPAERPARNDPYTSKKPGLATTAGYVQLGPFSWDARSTTDIEYAVGAADMCWIETAHFKLGCALAPRKINDTGARHRKQLKAELQALRRRLPTIPRNPRVLDRWLLAHLYAARLETTYRDFLQAIGMKGLPRFQADDVQADPARFLVALFDSKVQLQRYLEVMGVPGAAAEPRRHYVEDIDAVGFATASECIAGQLHDQVLMHAHLASEIAKNLVSGFGKDCMNVPAWFAEGLGHHVRRTIAPRSNFLAETIDPQRSAPHAWKWRDRVRKRVRQSHVLGIATLFDLAKVRTWGIHQHLMSWSHVEYLLQHHRQDLGAFLAALHEHHMRGHTRLERDAQLACLQRPFRLDFSSFDKKWRAFAARR